MGRSSAAGAWSTAIPSLCKPNRPAEAIVRLVLKATVVNVEIRKPAGKWEKVAGAPYASVSPDEDGAPVGLGLEKLPGLSRLMQDNRDSMVFASR